LEPKWKGRAKVFSTETARHQYEKIRETGTEKNPSGCAAESHSQPAKGQVAVGRLHGEFRFARSVQLDARKKQIRAGSRL
jgi:hypothetical protein